MMKQQLSDTDKETITEHVREIARFEVGDVVTMEPSDNDIPYHGQEYEGVPLTIERVFWRGTDMVYGEQSVERTLAMHDETKDEHVVHLPDADESAYVSEHTVVYEFEKNPHTTTNKDYHPTTLSETGLIPWSEYKESHDRVSLLSSSDYERHWLEPTDEPCDVCGCNIMKHWHYNDSQNTAGGRSCPACGDMKERHGP